MGRKLRLISVAGGLCGIGAICGLVSNLFGWAYSARYAQRITALGGAYHASQRIARLRGNIGQGPLEKTTCIDEFRGISPRFMIYYSDRAERRRGARERQRPMPKEIESEWVDAKPRIIVSRCLGFDACRWNGEMLHDEFVESLRPHVDFVTFCPECEIGLGVPRRPIRLVAPVGSRQKEPVEMHSVQLVQPASGLNVTQDMHDAAIAMLDSTDPPDGFLLKHRSPSCGPLDVRIYKSADDCNVAGKGAGLFAWNVSKQYPNLPIEDEGRLRNFLIREHWLTAVFAIARLRRVAHIGRMRHLIDFHARHKYLLMASSQAGLRRLGRIVAAGSDRTANETLDEYLSLFPGVVASRSRIPSRINALQHVFGHFSNGITQAERQYFLDLIEEYRREAMPLCVVVAILRSWAERFDNDYIRSQTLLCPYPESLSTLGDSGKGRDSS